MKKQKLLLILFFVSFTAAQGQYFKNSKYYARHAYYLYSIYTIDSLTLLSNSNGTEYYQMKKYQTEQSRYFKSLNFKIQDSVIYFKLNENKDSNYYPYYNLKLKKNDSFYLYWYELRFYHPNYSKFANVKIDSIMMYVGDTVTKYVNHQSYLTREIIHPNKYKIYFYDSLGFNATLHSGLDIPNTVCICSDDQLLYNITNYGNDLCLLDSFVARYQSEFGSINSINHNRYFKLFPNPAKGTFQIEISAKEPFDEISIFNGLGVCVLRQKITHSELIFDIAHLNAGLYSIHLQSQNRIVIDQLIIEK